MIEPTSNISSDHVAEHYDELDHWYRVLWGHHVHHGLWVTGRENIEEATRNLIHLLAMDLDIKEHQTVCDVGCGYGGTAKVLAESYGARVTGVTVSPAQFSYAQNHTKTTNSNILCMDFLRSELAEQSFEKVVAIESTEHFADKPRLFAEMHRIMKPGGCLGICAWLARAEVGPWESRRLLEPICEEGRMPGMGSEFEYRELVESAGFEVTSFTDVSSKVSRTWSLVVRRMLARLTWDREAWKFLTSGRRNIVFAKTTMRIAAAYRLGAMRYGIFIAQKPVRN